MVYLDDDIIEKLKQEPNASKLINELLTAHYNRPVSPEEHLKRVAMLEAKLEYAKKLEAINGRS